jgi:phage tail P2-like protein
VADDLTIIEPGDVVAISGQVLAFRVGTIDIVERRDITAVVALTGTSGTLAAIEPADIAAFPGINDYLYDYDLVNRYLPDARPGSLVLYPAATGLEKAMADTDAERIIRIPDWIITDQWDPYLISFQNLPFLAWAMSVNMWQDEWKEGTKRSWVARAWEFKSLRGTRRGMEMAVDYIGRDVSPWGYQCTKFTVPPQRVYSGPTMTKEEREAWLELMPQVRLWRVYERGIAGFAKSFYGGRGTGRMHNHRFCLSGEVMEPRLRAITPSTAIERTKHRARWIVRGVETDVTVTDFGFYHRVHLRGIENGSVFCNRPVRSVHPKRYYIPTTASSRLITIMPKERLSWRTPLWASREPLTAEGERIVIGSTRRRSVFSGWVSTGPRVASQDSWYYVPSDAWSRIYRRYAINDGSTELNSRRPVQFMGTGRYGFPKYTAWVGMSLRSQRRFAVFDGIPRRRFFLPHDPTPVKRAKVAVRASKKIADRILLELGPVPSFVAGRPFFAGKNVFIVGRSI